ncbi:MAG TPA: hypothetical protein VFW23_00865 [Tepidisphaeraceae bacterium]|nr:hypothetical protein [Tepidisphaeraceae bacterium]
MSGSVYIKGLVALANHVRRELSSRSVVADLRRQVEQNLQKVDEILLAHGAAERQLPAPSQRALQFLRGIDWNQATVSQTSQASETRLPQFSFPGVGRLLDRTLDRLANDLTSEQVASVRASIERASRQIERSIQHRRIEPDQLTPRSREQRGWLALFSRAEQLEAYINARRMAVQCLDAAPRSKKWPPPLLIQFRPINAIYKIQASPHGSRLLLATPMIAFNESQFASLADLVFGKRRSARQQILGAMTAEGFQTIRAELESLGGIVETARGNAYDLRESFNRMNDRYFGGKMARPRLTWSRTLTGRKFGHYDWIADTVMISRTLDDKDVPSMVMDFIMFHELLHKFHGLHWVNGRGYAHTGEFQQDERKFEQWKEAERILQTLASSI